MTDIREHLARTTRAALTGQEDPPPTGRGPGLFGLDSQAAIVHAETAMLVGGLRALIIQTLHPAAMAGVADHSDYRKDPWGRLHRTGEFIGTTTYGSVADAEAAIDRVRRIHERITGFADDGTPYSAADPHLLEWVHIIEVDSFLVSHRRYGSGKADGDRYVAEMAEVARRLGVPTPPVTEAELAARIRAYRPELRSTARAREAVRFLMVPPMPVVARGPYAMLALAATGTVPRWARAPLGLWLPPFLEPAAIRPSATAGLRALAWLLEPPAAAEGREAVPA